MSSPFASKWVALAFTLGALGLQGCMHLTPQPTVSGPLERAPAFSLPDANGQPVELGALEARGSVLVVFSRGACCPFCKLPLPPLSREAEKFGAANVSLVSISTA